ncbi:RelA/SpoT domain-containing protein [Photobacterium leiognathi]|uniref:RelA/SpoT domain-containing protein n=1 Tax=Photobacterium leiognathi TaxID=553611 RepID=UPI002980E909|nr:RelA/SpoT domain-containing protein [Photobacterium leiognathi]
MIKAEFDISSYEVPRFSKNKIKAAGERLVEGSSDHETLDILNNWRSAHALPLQLISEELNKIASAVDENALLAKRLKRSPSIINKLKIQQTMSLARMQDIGGCRTIVDSIDSVYHVNECFQEALDVNRHKLLRMTDYIKEPKSSGYRGIHLVIQFDGSEISEKHNGMKIEAQIRTRYQHYWATAVETMGAYLKQSLKSSQGDKRFLQLFAELGDLFAFYEGQPRFNNDIHIRKQASKVVGDSKLLQLHEKLSAFSHATNLIENGLDADATNADFYLVITDIKRDVVRVQPVTKDELKAANEQYTRLEQRFRNDPCRDIALVSAKTLADLRDTYPNYFSDTKNFLEHYHKVLFYILKQLNPTEESDIPTTQKEIQLFMLKFKRLITKRRSKNRAFVRKQRSLIRNSRKITNPKVKAEMEKKIRSVRVHTNQFCKKTSEIKHFYKNTVVKFNT